MTDDEVRAAAQKQAEEGFDGFINYMKKGTVVCILMLLGFTACNFGVEDDTSLLIMMNSMLKSIWEMSNRFLIKSKYFFKFTT